MAAKEKLCLALDVDSRNAAEQLVMPLSEYVGIFKIGFQLFIKEGPEIVTVVKNLGGEVFLDLKFHDIPNTVAQASRMITGLGVSMFNLHATGSKEMMKVAVDAAGEEAERIGIKKPKILAVTVLTSINQSILQDELKVTAALQDYVAHLASLAKESGIDGVIASPQEIRLIREACGEEFIIGTPGIRPLGSPPDDQRRTLTPKEAIEAGATFIVVGRPIRNAPNPIEAARDILNEIEDALI